MPSLGVHSPRFDHTERWSSNANEKLTWPRLQTLPLKKAGLETGSMKNHQLMSKLYLQALSLSGTTESGGAGALFCAVFSAPALGKGWFGSE